MKKLCLFIFQLVIVLSCILISPNYSALASSNKYARIVVSGSYLYKTASENPSTNNIWCILENTYFVKILNDYNDNFYKVSYNSIIGFAKKSDLSVVLSTPLMPYPSGINISINSYNGCYLRSSPISKTTSNNIITTLDKGTKNILFIGYVYGDENVDLKGNVWYLVKYEDEIGYIFSDFVESKVTIYPNLEEISLLNNNSKSALLNPLSNTTTSILIVVILIPCFIILLLMFFPKKFTTRLRKTNKIKEVEMSELTDIYNDIDV